MDTRTQDNIAQNKAAPNKANADKVVPQAPPNPAPVETDPYAWTTRQPQQRAPFFLNGGEDEDDDEPVPDVGGEVGKTPRLLTAWQITGLVVGGLAVAAGIVYLARSRQF